MYLFKINEELIAIFNDDLSHDSLKAFITSNERSHLCEHFGFDESAIMKENAKFYMSPDEIDELLDDHNVLLSSVGHEATLTVVEYGELL